MIYWPHIGEAAPSHNIVHHNTFFMNEALISAHEARDDGFNNSWFDNNLLKGNYWHGFTGGWYQIYGSANSFDEYPLEDPPIWPFD
ncbi:MAG: hypothetical protein ACTSO5_12940 [Candidatus Heimdallarchaeaceae archaeon]